MEQHKQNTTVRTVSTLLLLTSLLGCMTASARSQFTMPPEIPTSLTVPAVPQEIPQQTPNTTPPTLINPVKKKHPIQLSLKPSKASYSLGETMTLKAKTNKNCYLTVIDFGTSGAVNILFPNAYQQNNLLKAGKTQIIPNKKFDIKIAGKTGTETLWATCRKQKATLFSKPYNFKKHIFIPLGSASNIAEFDEITKKYNSEEEARQKTTIKIHK